MSDGGSNQRLPYNQSQRSSQPQHRQQQQQQQQGQPPHQYPAAAQQMGGYMMHQQPAWGGGGGVQQAQYDQAQQQQSIYQQQLYQQHLQQQQMQQQQQADYGNVPPAAGLHPQYQQALMANAYMNQQQAVPTQVQHMQVIQPRPGRLPADRPIMKLSVGLIETYKMINEVRG